MSRWAFMDILSACKTITSITVTFILAAIIRTKMRQPRGQQRCADQQHEQEQEDNLGCAALSRPHLPSPTHGKVGKDAVRCRFCEMVDQPQPR